MYLWTESEKRRMAKYIHKGVRNAVKTVAQKARAGRSASVMKPEYLESTSSRIQKKGGISCAKQ